MPLVIVQNGLENLLYVMAQDINDSVWKIGLFKNDLTPDVDTLLADVTPADFGGYSGLQTLEFSLGTITWVAPRMVVTGPDVTWTADGTSTNTVYGYYVTNDDGDVLRYIERRASGGVLFGATGQTYTVTPKLTLRSEF
jgi:hypothetical protein